jgi:hypothetical protein
VPGALDDLRPFSTQSGRVSFLNSPGSRPARPPERVLRLLQRQDEKLPRQRKHRRTSSREAARVQDHFLTFRHVLRESGSEVRQERLRHGPC